MRTSLILAVASLAAALMGCRAPEPTEELPVAHTAGGWRIDPDSSKTSGGLRSVVADGHVAAAGDCPRGTKYAYLALYEYDPEEVNWRCCEHFRFDPVRGRWQGRMRLDWSDGLGSGLLRVTPNFPESRLSLDFDMSLPGASERVFIEPAPE